MTFTVPRLPSGELEKSLVYCLPFWLLLLLKQCSGGRALSLFPPYLTLTLSGPPESMREHVVAASKAMKMGDWKTCHSFIINEKMNGKVWDLFPEADKVRTMLVR